MRSRALSAALAMILLLSPLLAGPAVSDEFVLGGGDDLGGGASGGESGGVSGGESGGVSGGESGGVSGGIDAPASGVGDELAQVGHVTSQWGVAVACPSGDDDEWTGKNPWAHAIAVFVFGLLHVTSTGTLILP